jgi:hypothetical protein
VKRHRRALTLAWVACAVAGPGTSAVAPADALPPVSRNGITAPDGSTGPATGTSDRLNTWRQAAAPVGALTVEGVPGYVHPTSDLDGDRVPDVTVLTSSPASLTCLSGADGHTLHTFVLGADHSVQPVDPAWSAMVVTTASTAQPGPTDPPHDVTLTISWVDGCVRRWARSFTGRVYAPGDVVSSDLPYLRGLLRNAAGTDLLVEQQTALAPPSGTVIRTTTTILSGTDADTLLSTDPEDHVDQEPTLVPMPDVSGDGRADYLTALRRRDAGPVPTDPDALVAHSAGDGAVLWSREAANDFDTSASAAGDVTGDGVTDVLVGTVVTPIDTALLDGASGEVLWTKPGQVPQVLGTSDGGPYISLDRLVPGEHLLYEVGTYDGHGTLVHRVRRDLGPSADVVGVNVSADTLGDIDVDGFRDTAYSVTAGRDDGSTKTVSWTLSGLAGVTRNANVHALKPDDAAPGAGSLDGHGDDVWGQTGPVVSLRAGDALTGLTTVTAPGTVASLLATQIDHSACADLVGLVTYRGTPSVVAISGRTGATVWSAPRLPAAGRPTLVPLAACSSAPSGHPPRPHRLPSTGANAMPWAALLLGVAAALARGVSVRR